MNLDFTVKKRRFQECCSAKQLLLLFVFLFLIQLAEAQCRYSNRNVIQIMSGISYAPHFTNVRFAGMTTLSLSRPNFSNMSYYRINPVSGNPYHLINQWSLTGLNAIKYVQFGSRINNVPLIPMQIKYYPAFYASNYYSKTNISIKNTKAVIR